MKSCDLMRWCLGLLVLCFCPLYATYELAVCAIFQDEAPYLKEWIEFHKLQGVQHFYLYNNNSQDYYLEVLAPYIHNKEVTLAEWPFTYEEGDHKKWISIQSGAYIHCIKHFGKQIKWLAVIDIDEFLFCVDGTPLPRFLKNYQQFGGLRVNWIKFGTSDVATIPPGFCLIELLIRCADYDHNENHFIKSIVQPRFVEGCKSAHDFIYKEGYYAVDADGVEGSGNFSKVAKLDKIRINHYWTRAVDYFMENKIASRQKRRPGFKTHIIMKMAESYNQQIDTAILQFVAPLRLKMGFEQF